MSTTFDFNNLVCYLWILWQKIKNIAKVSLCAVIRVKNNFEVENEDLSKEYDDTDSPCLTERKELDEIGFNILEYGIGATQ